MDLQCEFIFPSDQESVSAESAKEITVGDIFYAGCNSSEKLVTDKYKVKIEDNQRYNIKLLAIENQDNKLIFKFTSYQVGQHQFPKLELEQQGIEVGNSEKTTLNLGPVNFKVNSILNPQEKAEPIGALAGITIDIPLLYWVILIFFITSILCYVSGFLFFKWKRKKMLSKLEDYEITTSPLQQFYSTYRKVQRENAFLYRKDFQTEDSSSQFLAVLNELETSLKLFLLRKFKTPAMDKKWDYIIKDLNKYHKEFMSCQADELKEIIKEISKAKDSLMNLKAKDLSQIFEKVRLFVEFSEALQEAIKKNDKSYIKKLRSLKV